MRKPIIAGNWKMNNNIAETKKLIDELKPLVAGIAGVKCDVVVCAPYTSLAAAVSACRGSKIAVGAENVHWAEKGAYTGEITADMLRELGVTYVIIGHSERRQYFGETDETVNKRTVAALNGGLKVILCVGELLGEREDGVTAEVVRRQTKIALKGITAEQLKNIVIAYEPVWAIGTGKTATAQDANDTIKVIRDCVQELYGKKAANAIRIQYGGSMKPSNASELMAQPEIDGGLIGGASLKAEDFSKIVNF